MVAIPSDKKCKILTFIKQCFGKLSEREMARRVGIGKTTLNNWCKEIGLHHIKNSVNENFFDRWNEYSAYILGYIFADGNVAWDPRPHKSYWSLTITAAEKDKEHLEKIRGFISSTKPLLYAPKTKSYRMIVVSKNLCSKLIKIGVVPRKSLIVKFPNVPKEHLRHFIRGVVDGDGTIRYTNRKRSSYFDISIFSGSRRFLKKLARVVKKEAGIDAKLRRHHGNTFVVGYTCTRGRKLGEWIYKNAHICLERKFKQYERRNGVRNVPKAKGNYLFTSESVTSGHP